MCVDTVYVHVYMTCNIAHTYTYTVHVHAHVCTSPDPQTPTPWSHGHLLCTVCGHMVITASPHGPWLLTHSWALWLIHVHVQCSWASWLMAGNRGSWLGIMAHGWAWWLMAGHHGSYMYMYTCIYSSQLNIMAHS